MPSGQGFEPTGEKSEAISELLISLGLKAGRKRRQAKKKLKEGKRKKVRFGKRKIKLFDIFFPEFLQQSSASPDGQPDPKGLVQYLFQKFVKKHTFESL